VAEFLERSAPYFVQKDQMLADAAKIRAGVMPTGYQYMVTPH
jgi:hypothetical protein